MHVANDLDEDETALFRAAVHDAQPIICPRAYLLKPKPAPKANFSRAEVQEVLRESLNDINPWEQDLETGDELSYAQDGIQHNVLRRLRRGHYAVQAELDLHGLTVDAAKLEVSAFLQHCRDHQLRCVRIIHGKGLRSPGGMPVIKIKLAAWLRRCKPVLAYCSARPVDGGTGAVYVLLRTQSGRRG